MPDQAKGVGKGLSLEKHLAKWDRDGDGTLDHGPRFSHGVMGALLQLQMTGGASDAPGEDTDADGAAAGVTEAGASPSTGSDTETPAQTGASETPPTEISTPPMETASTDGSAGEGATPPADASEPDSAALTLLADATPPPVDPTTLDPSLLLDNPPA